MISINLVTPHDPYFLRLRAGYSYGFADKWYAGIELGYGDNGWSGIGKKKDFVTLNNENQFWEMRLEIKYIVQMRDILKPYLSTDIFYIHHTEIFNNGTYPPMGEGSFISYHEVSFSRKKYGSNLKMGILIMISNHFALEPYIGMGFRSQINNYTYPQGESHELQLIDRYNSDIPESWYIHNYAGEGYNISLTTGIKINFLF